MRGLNYLLTCLVVVWGEEICDSWDFWHKNFSKNEKSQMEYINPIADGIHSEAACGVITDVSLFVKSNMLFYENSF